jgi:multicomponent Na+:H+ antiporter subunit B
VINMVLLTLLAAVTMGIVRIRNLFAVAVLTGAYSFLMATLMVVLDAVDVAMTEASVGAGISMVLVLGALYLTRVHEAPPRHSPVVPLVVALGTGAMLIYGSFGLPAFGTAYQPVSLHVGGAYLALNMEETGIPNVVTAVLASWRGFDTLGETTVIFVAGIGVLLLLRRRRDEGPR